MNKRMLKVNHVLPKLMFYCTSPSHMVAQSVGQKTRCVHCTNTERKYQKEYFKIVHKLNYKDFFTGLYQKKLGNEYLLVQESLLKSFL